MDSEANKYFVHPDELAMALAIEGGDVQTIQKMIRSGIVQANGYGQAEKDQPISFLTYAVMVSNRASIEALVASGANPNFQTPDGWSAMAEACRSSDSAFLLLLLNASGDPNLTVQNDRTLTFVAYENKKWENLFLLLDRGANVNAQNSGGETLLLYMSMLNDYDHMFELFRRGADPLVLNRGGVSVSWMVQKQEGRLTPEAETKRQLVIRELEKRGVSFPVPHPPVWDPNAKKYVPYTAPPSKSELQH